MKKKQANKRIKKNMQTIQEVCDNMVRGVALLFDERGYDVSCATANSKLVKYVPQSALLNADHLIVKEISWSIPFLFYCSFLKLFDETTDKIVLKIRTTVWFPKKKKAGK